MIERSVSSSPIRRTPFSVRSSSTWILGAGPLPVAAVVQNVRRGTIVQSLELGFRGLRPLAVYSAREDRGVEGRR